LREQDVITKAIHGGERITKGEGCLGECADFLATARAAAASAEMAKKLAAAMGTSPEMWVNLRRSDDLTNAAEPDLGRLGAWRPVRQSDNRSRHL
jgi:hypothetical protein